MLNRTMMSAAFAVLDRLEPLAPDTWWLESYSNGREQGFNIWDAKSNRRVSFSRDRRSDDIVVYAGMYSDFDLRGNVFRVEARTFIDAFYFTKALDASNFIFNYLKELTDAPTT